MAQFPKPPKERKLCKSAHSLSSVSDLRHFLGLDHFSGQVMEFADSGDLQQLVKQHPGSSDPEIDMAAAAMRDPSAEKKRLRYVCWV